MKAGLYQHKNKKIKYTYTHSRFYLKPSFLELAQDRLGHGKTNLWKQFEQICYRPDVLHVTKPSVTKH